MRVDTCFARQPIFDDAGRVTAYEVLYRPAGTREAEISDPVEATMSVLHGAFGDIDRVDRLGGLLGYVNMPRAVLFDEKIGAYSPRRLGVEVLEDVEPDGALISALAGLRNRGYRVALDDFVLGIGRDVLLTQADVIKVDVLEHEDAELARVADLLRATGLVMLAEKVETWETMELCRSLGFEMFQGFFFARPEMMAGSTADRNRDLLTRLADVHTAASDLKALVKAIEAHVDLAATMLVVLNSPMIGFPCRLASVREAVTTLGVRRIVELATALVLAGTPGVGSEVVRLSLTRGRMCASMATEVGHAEPIRYFSTGALSILDVLSDLPMSDVVDHLPVAEDLGEALTSRTGEKGKALAAAVAYERANWDEIPQYGYELEDVSNAYMDAIDWCSRIMVVARSFT